MQLALFPEGLFYKAAALILGAFLLAGCVRGLWTRQDIYDEGSARWMTTTQIIGIVIALVLLAFGFEIIDFPDWAYERIYHLF
jgi:uncharacterized membrane protein HdeD (DUF308 family)